VNEREGSCPLGDPARRATDGVEDPRASGRDVDAVEAGEEGGELANVAGRVA